mmetsp:Transcript_8814/g.13078  ORF Transcript_8814/g.13078 Transcript_8814/m.13078 type:complete len:82 (+) Transcript_8814:100-345(+)
MLMWREVLKFFFTNVKANLIGVYELILILRLFVAIITPKLALFGGCWIGSSTIGVRAAEFLAEHVLKNLDVCAVCMCDCNC